jgi:hypothetical protein
MDVARGDTEQLPAVEDDISWKTPWACFEVGRSPTLSGTHRSLAEDPLGLLEVPQRGPWPFLKQKLKREKILNISKMV